MSLLYCTADRIAAPSGGGLVTSQELRALKELSARLVVERRDPTLSALTVLSRESLGGAGPEPWKWDLVASNKYDWYVDPPRLAHFYSGTFARAVAKLKRNGCKVVYTIAAHDREVSRREHEKMGLPFPYPHLTDPNQWKQYIDGYRMADVIICPSSIAANTVRAYGPDFAAKDIRVIPHGCTLPIETCSYCKGDGEIGTGPNDITDWDHCPRCKGSKIEPPKPLPKTFTVGYMGSLGCDKGVRYLLEAWKKLDYRDGSLLVLAGRDTATPTARYLLQKYGGGNVMLAGWQKSVSDWYNSLSLYVQPSATEGFGLEVLEAMSHARPVICSDGAGAVDLVREAGVGSLTYACNTDHLSTLIDAAKMQWNLEQLGAQARECAANYTWGKIRTQYQQVWEEVLR